MSMQRPSVTFATSVLTKIAITIMLSSGLYIHLSYTVFNLPVLLPPLIMGHGL